MTELRPAAVPTVPSASSLHWLPVPDWAERYGVVAGITTRPAGSFRIPADLPLEDCRRSGSLSWDVLRTTLGFSGMVTSRQVHGVRVAWHRPVEGWVLQDGYDGHGTGAPDILLTVTVADCIPVYVLDPSRRVLALFHAGWRGTAASLLPSGLEKVLEVSRGSARDLVIHLGVGICARCYEVGPEVLAACGVQPSTVPPRLDLRGILARQAVALGVGEISTSPWCSAHDKETFFSHRASAGGDGRMVGFLGWPA